MVSDRDSRTEWCEWGGGAARLPRSLGVPVNLPAETLEKGNATSLARKTCRVGSGRSVGRS